jgi:microcystin-dependent protein
MPDLDLVTQPPPSISVDREVVEGTLRKYNGQYWAQVDNQAQLWGPVFGGDDSLVGKKVCLGISQKSAPFIIWPSLGGGGGSDVDVNADAAATTLAPGAPATAVVTEPSANFFHFAFGIPQGTKGDKGDKGDPGAAGTPGPPGTVYDSDQVGTIKSFSGQAVPTNWMLADGRSLLRTDYPDLFNAIGTTYGNVDSTHFNLPDLRSKFIYGAATIGGQGATGGEATHLLTGAESGQKAVSTGGRSTTHSHPTDPYLSDHGTGWAYAQNSGVAVIYIMNANTGVDNADHTHAIAASNAANAHNNLPPYILIAQIIKVTGAQINAGGALQGATGAKGDKGDKGDTGPMGTVYDTDQVGTVKTFAGKTIPTNWMLADGRSLSRTAYPDLFTAIGTTYGSVDAASFNIPDLRSRFVYGAAQADLSDVGTKGGEATHLLTGAESGTNGSGQAAYPSNPYTDYSGAGNSFIGSGGPGSQYNVYKMASNFAALQTRNADTAHNNLPPYILIAQIIKHTGVQVDSGGALVGPAGPAGAAGGQVFTQIIGDGAATSFTVNHGFNNQNVTVVVRRNSQPYDQVDCDVEHTGPSVVTVRTAPTVPAVGEYVVQVAAPGTQATLSITMDVWHTVGAAGEPAFANGWVNVGGAWGSARFRKFPEGRVRLAGAIKGPSGSACFTLPVGYRPPSGLIVAVAANADDAIVTINPDGTVVPQNNGSSIVANSCFLDGIEFDIETVSQVASIVAQPIETWHQVGAAGEPAFQNSWVNFDVATMSPVGFKKFPDGRVRLRGQVKTGTAGLVIFTLPAGYRPPLRQDFAPSGSPPGPAPPVGIAILADGTVVPSSSQGNARVSLDGMEFDTETVGAYAPGVIGPPTVTSLPLQPLDGQECYYRFTPTATPANAIPLFWHLRYDLVTAKWYPVNDPVPLEAFFAAGVSTSMGSGAWGTYDANDPRVTTPLPGIYDIETGTSETYAGVAINMNVGIGINGTVIPDREGGMSSFTAGWPVTGYANYRGVALNANDIIRQYYFLTTAGPQNVVMRGRYILMRPRRIG